MISFWQIAPRSYLRHLAREAGCLRELRGGGQRGEEEGVATLEAEMATRLEF